MYSTLKNKLWLLIPLAVVVAYWQLPLTFWQQDEWHHFGVEFIWRFKGFANFIVSDVISPFGVRFLPFTQLANYFQFSLFGENPVGYSLISLTIHILNSLLLYLVTLKLTKEKRISLIASLIFAVAPSSSQAVTWLMQHTGTLTSLTFSLISVLFFVDYLEQKGDKKLFLSCLSLILAIGFKEIAFFLFPFLVYLTFLYRKGKEIKNINYKAAGAVILTGLAYATFVIWSFLSRPREESAVFIPRSGFFQTLIRRMFSVPLRVTAQSFFTEKLIYKTASFLSRLPIIKAGAPKVGSPQYDVFVEQVVTKRLMYLLGLLILGFAFLAWRKLKGGKKNQVTKRRTILIALGFVVLSSFPLLFISPLAGNFVFIESRYLYVAIVGSSLLLAMIFENLFLKHKRIGWILLVTFLTLNIYQLNMQLKQQVSLGRTRKSILADIRARKPDLPDKVVFYTETDKSFYGLPADEKIMPFQSGFGQTLLVWYQSTENFPADFFEGDFLWPITEQGYKEVNERGFGYFRDYNRLQEAVESYKLPKDSVIAFKYDSISNNLIDITDEIRLKLLENEKAKQ